MTDTIFGKIVSGEIPAEFLYEDEHCVAINDINPQAPVHVLVIPKRAIARLVDAQADDQALLGHLMLAAGKVASQLGVDDAFRLIVNNGAGAGQTVFHLHLHILAGRGFAEGQMAGFK
ncbi:histidine triad nucleotide-binding protein [Haliea sp. E1-2-M8]|uniref:histidine triad nucleotide-binding protein n=1 Tax=Haliea sp. E1-2-M8 TaxID=3064706 RepID=UPI00271FE340|nr:histidine triad nucleotide-binding protein [Haliea sp. E1-2-M8]MDO8862145.1 histidine triad nucleotide-binding protein [Haliea sp. E1-2-M8]